jgi:hypothetical protein
MGSSILEKLESECIKHANAFGCLEINQVIGLPVSVCQLNRVPTILFPVVKSGSELTHNDQENQQACKLAFKETHQIIRIEIQLDDSNQVTNRRWVIISDLVSSRFINNA